MKTVKASAHQGSDMYISAGRQCVSTSYVAIILSMFKHPSLWTTKDLDSILCEGDMLYQQIGLSERLLVSELPVLYKNTILNLGSVMGGPLVSETVEQPFSKLIDALHAVDGFCFLTVQCYTVAVIKADRYYVFDSHSRSETGLCHPNGTAVLTQHADVPELFKFILHLSTSLGCKDHKETPFELNIVTVTHVSDPESSDSDFEGFSEISEGEYTCQTFINQENLREKLRYLEEENFTDGSGSLSSSLPLSDVLSTFSECSDFEDNIPLSELRKFTHNQCDSTESASDSLSEIHRSDSDFVLSADENKIMEDNFSTTDSDSFEIKLKKTESKKEKEGRQIKIQGQTKYNSFKCKISTSTELSSSRW